MHNVQKCAEDYNQVETNVNLQMVKIEKHWHTNVYQSRKTAYVRMQYPTLVLTKSGSKGLAIRHLSIQHP